MTLSLKSSRAFVLWAAFLPLVLGCTRQGPDYKNTVVVKVNNEVLTAEDFGELLAGRLRMFNILSSKDTAVIAQAKSAVVSDFIVHVVTQEWAQKNQLFVRKEQLDDEISKIRKNYPDDISFRKALADEGVSFDRWEARLKFTLLEKLVTDFLRKSLKSPTEEDIRRYYMNNKSEFQQPAAMHLKQIVTKTYDDAQTIRKELNAGKAFASLAKKFSISAEAHNGGDMGWVEKGVADVFDSSLRLNVGQRSNIIKSPFGYHILELVAKRQGQLLPLDVVRPRIVTALQAQQEQKVYSSWLEKQILEAHVYKNDGFINKIQVRTRSVK